MNSKNDHQCLNCGFVIFIYATVEQTDSVLNMGEHNKEEKTFIRCPQCNAKNIVEYYEDNYQRPKPQIIDFELE